MAPQWKERFREFTEYVIENKKLRKKREKAKTLFFNSIGLCISLAMVIIAFEWNFSEQDAIINLGSVETEFEEIIEIPVSAQPPPSPPKQQAVNIMEVADILEIEDNLEVMLDVEVTEETKLSDVVYEATTEEPEIKEHEEEAEEVFFFVEELPQPVGGMENFYQYIAENLVYPITARKMVVEGKVYIQFTVNPDGSLIDFEILKGIGFGCDNEAVRVLKESPKWEARNTKR